MPTPGVIDRVRELREQLPSTEELARQIDTVLIEPTKASGFAGLRERLDAALSEYPTLRGAIQGVITELTAAGL